MARRMSAMGSSRFEFNPIEFDSRYQRRNDIYTSAYAEILSTFDRVIAQHADGDIVTKESLTEFIGRKLVEELIRRRGNA